MAIATHTKAADDHKSAAKAHETAAQMHTKGDHAAAFDSATKAKGCADAAHKSTAEAHSKSEMHAKK
jgi:hypothetical protein